MKLIGHEGAGFIAELARMSIFATEVEAPATLMWHAKVSTLPYTLPIPYLYSYHLPRTPPHEDVHNRR